MPRPGGVCGHHGALVEIGVPLDLVGDQRLGRERRRLLQQRER